MTTLIAKKINATPFSRPVFATSPLGDKQRLFVVEQQTGMIRILRLATGTIDATPFLQVTGLSTGNEQGLLGLAFAPDYSTSGLLYVSFTDTAGISTIRRYGVSAANPNVADPGTALTVITVPQPFANHNGGWIAFSPKDKFLYFGLGDGGSENDPNKTSQDPGLLLGKMLRIDVTKDDFPGDPKKNYGIPPDNPFLSTPGFLREIWALGLRNPWRCSFDRKTGDLYMGDVGQNKFEEIDFQPAASKGGQNYGWSLREGKHPFHPVTGTPLPTLTDPIFEYSHDNGEQGVIGGYVYRGAAIPDLQGTYFFADLTGTVSSFVFDGTAMPVAKSITDDLFPGGIEDINSFGEDDAGEIYLCIMEGSVFRIDKKILRPPLDDRIDMESAMTDPFQLTKGRQMDRRRIRFEQLVPAENLQQDALLQGLSAVDHAEESVSLTSLEGSISDAPVMFSTPQTHWAISSSRESAASLISPTPLITPSMTVAKRPRDMALRDWAIYLLHNAALIEHALMVQYLYAMYSLDESVRGPAANDSSVTVSVATWIPQIRAIAIEEMGHLLTVQNILRYVGGSITFAREDFPIPTEVYPFQFELEPLTKDVLAKYVYAEMPDGAIDPTFIDPAMKADIEMRAKAAASGGNFTNHVGTLYASLLNVFSDPAFKLPTSSGLPPASDTKAVTFQATVGVPWPRLQPNGSIVPTVDSAGVVHPVKLKGPRLLSVNSIDDVLSALSFIARQGEASDPGSMRLSHFGRFLEIYKTFPVEKAAGWVTSPAKAVPKNPVTNDTPSTKGAITHTATQLWARLFDVRYRILLASLTHITAIPNITNPGDTTATAEAQALVDWIFQLMLEQRLSISGLAKLLTSMPLADPPTKDMAGAPFTMPYTTTIRRCR